MNCKCMHIRYTVISQILTCTYILNRASEAVPVAGPQTPVFHSGVAKKKVPAVVGQADKVDVWSRGRLPEPAVAASKTDN